MPRGGKRPGAGRPRGSSSKKAKVSAALAPAIGMKPLDIMIAIMRRITARKGSTRRSKPPRRSPFISARNSRRPTSRPFRISSKACRCSPISRTPVAAPGGKKELALLDAERTEWGDDFRRLNL